MSGEFGEAIAVGVPGNRRQLQLELMRKGFADSGTIAAKRGERANSSTELQRENARANLCQSHPMAKNAIQPPGHDKSECGGKRLLHPCARHHGSSAMFFRQAGEGAGEALQILVKQFQCAAKL